MVGGFLAWLAGKISDLWSRWISLITIFIDFTLTILIWFQNAGKFDLSQQSDWMIAIHHSWIPQFGVNFHFALDGISLVMLILTMLLGILSVLTSWKQVNNRVGFFHFNLLWILAGITGVFLSVDLFLFYFFWEVMLVPMYFLIGIWGYENRLYAAYKFFLFTQGSGLLMLLAILGLYFIHGQSTGTYTFDYTQLIGTALSPVWAFWLMLGFLIAFIVKLPLIPFHTWLPDAHTEAPTAGSVVLAGLLLKTGAYGIIRFVLPLFPLSSESIAPVMMLLGVAGILYGAKLAFAQTDLKRMVAYTSVSHMGFVVLGIFSFNALAMQGVIMQMITHGISTGALFILAGSINERLHTRDLDKMGGFWTDAPRMGGVAMIFTMASLGLPGLGNFVAEFLVLVGAYQSSVLFAVLASLGLIASSIYALRLIQQIFFGENRQQIHLKDLNIREMIIMVSLVIPIFWLGLKPQPIFNLVKPAIYKVLPQPERHVHITQEKDRKNNSVNAEPFEVLKRSGKGVAVEQ